jgi:hypothetical protein
LVVSAASKLRFCHPAAALDALRAEVTQSQWAMDFRADMRSSVVVRAVEVRGGSLSW